MATDTSSSGAARYDAALAALDPQRGDRVLEIGCGHGVAVGLVAARLGGDGHVHAVDRSATMVAAAERRNRDLVDAGVASFAPIAAEDATFAPASFDAVLAIRVRTLWAGGASTLERVHGWLRPGGRVHLVVDDPGTERRQREVAVARAALESAGFEVEVVEHAGEVVVVSGRA